MGRMGELYAEMTQHMDTYDDYDYREDRFFSEVPWSYKDYALNLVHNSSFDDERKAEMEREIEDANIYGEIDEMVIELENNQLDPITHGRGYIQRDIHRHLDKLQR